MIQRRRSRLKPLRIIRRRTGYPSLHENVIYSVPSNSLTNNGNGKDPIRGGQVNDKDADQWAVIWPG